MMRFVFAAILLNFLMPFEGSGQPKLAAWGEAWSHHNWAGNNLSPGYDFFINTTVVRGGPRLFLTRKEGKSLSLDPYIQFESVTDVFDQKHRNIFNNNGKAAVGAKWFYRNYSHDYFIEYFQFELYTEHRWLINYSAANNELFAKLGRKDHWTGLRCWSNSSSDEYLLGYELWNDFSYRKTNFSDKGNENYLIMTLSPVVLLHPFGILRNSPLERLSFTYNPELVVDMLGKEWNSNPYSNRFLNRLGMRYIFFKNTVGLKLQFFLSICYFMPITQWLPPCER